MPRQGFRRTGLAASRRKSERVNLHSMMTESASAAQPITSGLSSMVAANSESTTEHRRLSHSTPIATKVECRTPAEDYRTFLRVNVCGCEGMGGAVQIALHAAMHRPRHWR